MSMEHRGRTGYCFAGPFVHRWVYVEDPVREFDRSDTPWSRDVALSPIPSPWCHGWEANLTDVQFEAEVNSWDADWCEGSDLSFARSYLFEPPWRDHGGAPPAQWLAAEPALDEVIRRNLSEGRHPFLLRTAAAFHAVVSAAGLNGAGLLLCDLVDSLASRGWSLSVVDATNIVIDGSSGGAIVGPRSMADLVACVQEVVAASFEQGSGRSAVRERAKRQRALSEAPLTVETLRHALIGTGRAVAVVPTSRVCVSVPSAQDPWREVRNLAWER